MPLADGRRPRALGRKRCSRMVCAPLPTARGDALRGEQPAGVLARGASCRGLRLLLLDSRRRPRLPARGVLEPVDALTGSHPALATVQVAHGLEELAGSTTHALLLRGGRVVAAGPAGEVLREEPLSRCFGARVRLARAGDRVLAVIERGEVS